MTSHAGLPDAPDLASAEGGTLASQARPSPIQPWTGIRDEPNFSSVYAPGPSKEDLDNFSPHRETSFRGCVRLRTIQARYLTMALRPVCPVPLHCAKRAVSR